MKLRLQFHDSEIQRLDRFQKNLVRMMWGTISFISSLILVIIGVVLEKFV